MDPDALLTERIINQYLHTEERQRDAFPMKPSQAAADCLRKKDFINLPKPDDISDKEEINLSLAESPRSILRNQTTPSASCFHEPAKPEINTAEAELCKTHSFLAL